MINKLKTPANPPKVKHVSSTVAEEIFHSLQDLIEQVITRLDNAEANAVNIANINQTEKPIWGLRKLYVTFN